MSSRTVPHCPAYRIVAACCAFVALCCGAGRAQAVAPGAAGDATHRVLARLIERNPTLQTFEADVQIRARMQTFPYLAPVLNGTAYFARPGKYEVVFRKLPWYAKNVGHLYADLADPETWERRFVVTADGERTVDGRTLLALRLVQRVHGMIDHEEVYVDPQSWLIEGMDYHYYNGGTIEIRQTFAGIDGYELVASQTATIRIPHLHAVATATYTGYRTNVVIDDAIFEKNEQVQQ